MSGGVSPIYKGLGGLKTRRPEGAKVPANAEPLVKSMEDACTYTLGSRGLANRDLAAKVKNWYNRTWLGKRLPIK